MRSRVFRFVGANIKGNPPMSADKVAADLATIEARADILVAQEFRWPWYWAQARRVLTQQEKWRSFPPMSVGLAAPVFGGQPVMWRGSAFRRLDALVAPLHRGERKISETRYIRGVLLSDRTTALAVWAVGTHFVVSGDNDEDGPRRREILAHDIEQLNRFLAQLRTTGHPIVLQLDANIRPTSDAWPAFRRIIRRHGGTFHGDRGVEYLATFDGPKADVEVHTDYRIPAWRLNTDHEARGIRFRLIGGDS